MKNKKWDGILEVLEINHTSKEGQILWSDKNLKNILHSEGEEYFLKVLFTELEKTDYYYMGLDNRGVISVSDGLANLVGEPTTHGYTRQTLSSTTSWTFSISEGNRQVKSAIITFTANAGTWGPVANLFMTMQDQDVDPTEGYLISTVALGSAITLHDGESVSLRMAIKLRDCSIV